MGLTTIKRVVIKLVNKQIIAFLISFFISIICIGQYNKSLYINMTNDSLISVNLVEKHPYYIKVYDEELMDKMKVFQNKSEILPEGFSDYYLYEILEMMVCKKDEFSIPSSLSINRKQLMNLSREKIDTITFYKRDNEKSIYMLAILKIEE